MRRWPWAPIAARHIAQARKLRSARDVVVYFSALVLGCELECPPPSVQYDRPIQRADVDQLSGYSSRHVRLAFEQLELRLEVRRKFGTSAKSRAPFQLELPFATRIDGDPCGAAHTDQRGSVSGGAHTDQRGSVYTFIRARNPDPDLIQPDPSVRSASLGGRTDGRLEKLAWELFPKQHKPYGREYLAALRAHALAPSDAELAEFLRALSKDATVETARQPLAVAAKSDRLEDWLKRRRRLRVVVPRPPRGDVEEISESEREEVRALALQWTQGRRKRGGR